MSNINNSNNIDIPLEIEEPTGDQKQPDFQTQQNTKAQTLANSLAKIFCISSCCSQNATINTENK